MKIVHIILLVLTVFTIIAHSPEILNHNETKYIKPKYMQVSWYGPGFHGRQTANGETFNKYALTAAHKKLPFDTILELTNPRNNKTIKVRVNDRGPYIAGRNLDISYASALKLDIVEQGVAKLMVRVLK